MSMKVLAAWFCYSILAVATCTHENDEATTESDKNNWKKERNTAIESNRASKKAFRCTENEVLVANKCESVASFILDGRDLCIKLHDGRSQCKTLDYGSKCGHQFKIDNFSDSIQIYWTSKEPVGVYISEKRGCVLGGEAKIDCHNKPFPENGIGKPGGERATYIFSGKISSAAIGGDEICAIVSENQIECINVFSKINYISNIEGKPKKIVSGSSHFCLLLDNERVRCWGLPYGFDNGKNRIRSRVSMKNPLDIGFEGVVEIDAMGYSTCLVVDSGRRISCIGGLFGVDSYKQDQAFKSLDVGMYEVCAISKNGKVECWTRRIVYDLVKPEILGPVHINFGGKVVMLAVGNAICAIIEGGRVRCIGNRVLQGCQHMDHIEDEFVEINLNAME